MKTLNTIHFLSMKGRLSRGKFWLYWLLILLGQIGVSVLSVTAREMDESQIVIISLVLTGLLYLQLIKRMHDVGRSGWYSLVPIYNLILALTRGDEGANEYGQDPNGESDGYAASSDVLDQPIQSEVLADSSYSIESDLKHFLVYTIVSRMSYFIANVWWSSTMNNSSDSADIPISTYQFVMTFITVIFTVWLFILMGRSGNKWMQWILFYIIVHSGLTEILRIFF